MICAYPVGDVLIMAGVAALHALPRRPDGPRWSWIGAGLVAFVVGDVVYAIRVFNDSYSLGDPVDAMWVVGLLLIAIAVWLPPTGKPAGGSVRWSLTVPVLALVLSVAILVAGNFRDVPVAAVFLATITLILVVVRAYLCMRALRRLAEAERLAATDVLTGLPNRRSAVESLGLLAWDLAADQHLVVLILDVDGFKQVNDTLRHAAGDAVLCRVADAITDSVRPNDVTARIGGDEFVVATVVSGDPVAAECTGRRLGERIRDAIEERHSAHLQVTVSIGLALGPRPGESLTALLSRADMAMYAQKRAGRRLPDVPTARRETDPLRERGR